APRLQFCPDLRDRGASPSKTFAEAASIARAVQNLCLLEAPEQLFDGDTGWLARLCISMFRDAPIQDISHLMYGGVLTIQVTQRVFAERVLGDLLRNRILFSGSVLVVRHTPPPIRLSLRRPFSVLKGRAC